MHYCGIIISHKTYDILFSYVHIATMFFLDYQDLCLYKCPELFSLNKETNFYIYSYIAKFL